MHVFDILLSDIRIIALICHMCGFEPVGEKTSLLILFLQVFRWWLHIKVWVFEATVSHVDNAIEFYSLSIIDLIFLFLGQVRCFHPQLSIAKSSALQSHFSDSIPFINVWRYLSIFNNAQICTIIFPDFYLIPNWIILLFLDVPYALLRGRFPDGWHYIKLLPDSKVIVWYASTLKF